MEPQKNLEIPRAFVAQPESMNNSPHEVGNFGFEKEINQIDNDKARAEALQAFSNPATAKDIDLMEDEWVKDLKKMIVDTKGDPYAREVRFKEMQMDYLKKRYNRIINGGK